MQAKRDGMRLAQTMSKKQGSEQKLAEQSGVPEYQAVGHGKSISAASYNHTQTKL